MEYALTLDDYLAIVKRRILYLIIPFIVGMVIAVAVVISLAPVFLATGKIAVESQQIPKDLVRSTVTSMADERIGFIQQRVMTRKQLEQIIDKFQLYPEQRGRVPVSVLVAKLRQNTSLDLVKDRFVRRHSATNTVAFTISFEHGDPQIAADVVNELIRLFLEENAKTRTARASETTEFLEQEASKLSNQMQAMEEQVAAYKQKHRDALPEHLNLRMDMLERAKNGLQERERDIKALEGQTRLLEIERLSGGSTITPAQRAGARPVMSPHQQLAALRSELIQKSAVYASAHPDLRNLRRKISVLEQEVKAIPTGLDNERPEAVGTDAVRARIDSQIATAEAQIASLRAQEKELHGKIEKLEAQIIEIPQVERGLKELTRDYEHAVNEYEEFRAKQMDAQLAERLETEQKAERFVLLERAVVPRKPVKPDRTKLLLMGFVLAAGSGGGALVAAEFLDKTIRGSGMLTSILQSHPLAVIPYIRTSADLRAKTRRRWIIFVILVLVSLISVLLIHFFYQPLDMLLSNLLDRIALL